MNSDFGRVNHGVRYTPYVGMARKQMAAPYNAYKIIRSELGFDYSHRLL